VKHSEQYSVQRKHTACKADHAQLFRASIQQNGIHMTFVYYHIHCEEHHPPHPQAFYEA
jgi:hypothetical protein